MTSQTMHRGLLLAIILPLACSPAAVRAETLAPGSSGVDAGAKMVGGAVMSPTKSVIENIGNSNDHTALAAALKAAGLDKILKGPGPFTVFAPTNAAFAKMPAGTLDTLMKPENKERLAKALSYHVIAGDFTTVKLTEMARTNGGKVVLTTLEGEKLTVTEKMGTWHLKDAQKGKAKVTITDVTQSNGVVHVIDTVLAP